MGMYTHLYLGIELRKETPQEVIDVLKYMIDGDENWKQPELPDHPLFKCTRWKFMLQCSSAYFSTQGSHLWWNDIHDEWELRIDCSFKNYDNELEHFLDWIYPWCFRDEMIGFHRYEENEYPTLIFCDEYGKPFREVKTQEPLEL